MPRRNTAMVRATFSLTAGLMDFAIVFWTAVVVQSLYHSLAYGWSGLSSPNLQPCLFAAVLFVVSNTMRHE